MIRYKRLKKYERRSLIVLFIAIAVILFTELFLVGRSFGGQTYLTVHVFLEIISITISFAIAMQSWIVFSYRSVFSQLILFSTFLSIGVFDFFYTLSFHEASICTIDCPLNTSVLFRVVARLVQAGMILWLIILQDYKVTRKIKNYYLIGTIGAISALTVLIFYIGNQSSILYIGGTGPTIWYTVLEAIIWTITLFSIVQLWLLYRKDPVPKTLALLMATTFFLMSEILFVFNITLYDIENLLARIFKVISFFYYMQGIYIATIQEPYEYNVKVRESLEEREHLLQAINNSMGEGLMVLDKDQNLIMLNPEGERILGYTQNELMQKNIHKTIHYRKIDGTPYSLDECPIYQTVVTKEKIQVAEDVFIGKDGKAIPVSYTATPLIEKGRLTGSVVTFKDISEEKKTRDRIRFLAYHNSLTKLPNRYYFFEQIEKEMQNLKDQEKLGLILMDVDNLQNINDNFGPEIGDLVIIEYAKKLTSHQFPLFVAHLDSDEFGILVKDIEENIKKDAIFFLESVKDPFLINGKNIFVSVSMGISIYPTDARDPGELLQFAHIALYHAKRKGKGQILFYNEEMDRIRQRNAWIEENLYEALIDNQISVHYQTIVHTRTNKIVGIEALARWHHPEKGFIPPNQFIPIAENNGLIIPMGTFIFNKACQDLATLHHKGLRDLFISINLSLQQLKYPNFLQFVDDIIRKYGLSPEHVVFEITESITLTEDRELIQTLQQFKKRGYRLAIDDFGKGYSSIGYLREITIDTIKIDKSYLWNVTKDQTVARLTNAIIAMADSLNIDVIVEGVEDKEHLNFIKKHPRIAAQGYLFNKPGPFHEILSLFEKSS